MSNVIKVLGMKNSGGYVTYIPYNSFFYRGGKLKSVDFIDGNLQERFIDERYYSLYRYQGAWAVRNNWVSDTGLLYDQRSGLGTARAPLPLRAMSFNGTNQYAQQTVDPVTEFPFTLFGWVKPSGSGARTVCSLANISASNEYFAIVVENSKFIVRRRHTTAYDTNVGSGLPNDVWGSVVVVFNSSTSFSVYSNGELVQEVTGLDAVTPDSSFNRLLVGALRTLLTLEPFSGAMANYGFLRRAATLEDAQEFHTTGIIPDAEVLLPLDNNSTTVSYNIGRSASWWLNEPRRNLLQFTQSLAANPVYWTPLGATVGTGVAPIVTDNYELTPYGAGTRLQFNLGGGTSNSDRCGVNCSISPPVGTPYSVRFYFKSATTISDAIIANNHFGLIAGAGATTSYTFTDMGNGYTRVDQKVTPTATGGTFRLQTLGNVGPNTLDIVVAGLQLELGSTATDYQPVLGSGIEYPEATLVNAPTSYVGRDVKFSRQNKIGYSTRRNLLTFSDQFNLWGSATQVTANTHYDPNGELRADTVNRPGNSSYAITSSNVTLTPGETYCWSIWCRSNTNNKLTLMVWNGSERPLVGAKLTGAGSISISGGTYAQITSLDSSWSQFQVTFTAGSNSSGQHQLFIYPVTSAGVGDLQSGSVVISNALLNVGTSPMEYQSIGANPGTTVLFPALLADPTKSVARDTLEFQGEAHMDGQLEDANCFNFDGVDDWVEMDLGDVAGQELVVNGTFTNDTTGWTAANNATLSVSSNRLSVVNGLTAAGQARSTINTIIGRSYMISVEFTTSGARGLVFVGDFAGNNNRFAAGGAINSAQTVKGVFIATQATHHITVGNWDNGSGLQTFYDNVSVRELPTTLGPEIRQNGIIGLVGTATAATYNTTTGQGNVSRVDASNQSFVQFTGLNNALVYRLQVQNTGAIAVNVRSGSQSGTIVSSVAVGTSATIFATPTSGVISITSSGGNGATFTLASMNQAGVIEHDGTSILTYRSQADGFTGTAGTAFNIRFGDVEHIPCSEGGGQLLGGSKLNQQYQVVNGQASNWTTNQNTYHANTVLGHSQQSGDDILTDDEKIAALFENGEVGCVFDPYDTSTLFQDHTGLTPVTDFGQTVGLHLDKSKGLVLGPELNTGLDFATWNGANVTSKSGNTFTTSTAGGCFKSNVVPAAGKTYLISMSGTITDGRTLTIRNSADVNGQVQTSNPSFSLTFRSPLLNAVHVSLYFQVSNGAATVTINSLSIREIQGNHRYQSTAGSRTFYARKPATGIRNLFERVEQLSNAYWNITSGVSVTDNAQINPRTGLTTVSDIREAATNGFHLRGRGFSFLASTQYTMSCILAANGRQFCGVNGGNAAWLHNATFDLINGTIVSTSASATATITRIGTSNYYYCTLTATSSGTPGTSNCQLVLSTDGTTVSYLGDVTRGVFASEMMLNVGGPLNYQRVVTTHDVTEAGVPEVRYLQFATSRWMETNAIDFSGTDGTTVVWAGRNPADPANSVLLELSPTSSSNNGSFLLERRSTGGYLYRSRGTSQAEASLGVGYSAPTINVVTGIGDISSDTALLRINGVQVASVATDQGSGNLGSAYKLYFGSRAGSSLFADDEENFIFIRGASTPVFNLEQIENIAASKLGIADFHLEDIIRIPASLTNPGFDILGNVLTNPPKIGLNDSESTINFSPVENSWPDIYSIPGADLSNYEFDGDPGDIQIKINRDKQESRFTLES